MTDYEKRQTRIDELTTQAIKARGIKRAVRVGMLRLAERSMRHYMATHTISGERI